MTDNRRGSRGKGKKQKPVVLPEPECRLGYTHSQVKSIIGEEKWDKWCDFSTGQTCGYCPVHGVATYGVDIAAFLEGHPPLD